MISDPAPPAAPALPGSLTAPQARGDASVSRFGWGQGGDEVYWILIYWHIFQHLADRGWRVADQRSAGAENIQDQINGAGL